MNWWYLTLSGKSYKVDIQNCLSAGFIVYLVDKNKERYKDVGKKKNIKKE